MRTAEDDLPLGQLMRAVRKNRGLSQERFAKIVGLRPDKMPMMENGKLPITLKTLMRVSKGMNIPAWKILRRAECLNRQIDTK